MFSSVRLGDFLVEYDGVCWAIFYTSIHSEKSKLAGEEKRKAIAFYARLDGALKRVLDEKLGAAGVHTAHEIIAEIRRARDEITAAVNGVEK